MFIKQHVVHFVFCKTAVVCYSFFDICSFIVIRSYVIVGLGWTRMGKCFHTVICLKGKDFKNLVALMWHCQDYTKTL